MQRRRVYAVTGVAPEWLAYAMAKYSRSAQSLQESIQELTADRTRKFLNTMYFKYGHASIADMAHLSFGVEGISLWAAITLVDEQLWDGQERSTRYQPFRETGYYPAPEGAPCGYDDVAQWLMMRYEQATEEWIARLQVQYPRPDGMAEVAYTSSIRARAFDIARYYLFLGVKTSVGQITSARTLERQIARMQADPLPEIRALGAELKEAATETAPFDFAGYQLEPLIGALPEGLQQPFREHLAPHPVAPTLVKYADASPYQQTVWADVAAIARELLPDMAPQSDRAVVLHVNEDPLEAAVASLLYRVSDLSYGQIRERVASISAGERKDVLEAALQRRGAHDEWLREFQGAPFAFDIQMDIGGYRDFHRHRRAVQIRQAWTTKHGAAIPEPMLGTGAADRYAADMARAARHVEELTYWDPVQAHYLLPLGFRCRTLFRMDLSQAAYMIRLRTKEGGHFSYRRVAYQMYEALAAQYPSFAACLEPTNPDIDDPLKRS
jgi:thymidylate synthase ThyX